MSRCARCGWEGCASYTRLQQGFEPSALLAIACRDRELSNLRSLMRSVTGKLEEAGELLLQDRDGENVVPARELVDEVLEALS